MTWILALRLSLSSNPYQAPWSWLMCRTLSHSSICKSILKEAISVRRTATHERFQTLFSPPLKLSSPQRIKHWTMRARMPQEPPARQSITSWHQQAQLAYFIETKLVQSIRSTRVVAVMSLYTWMRCRQAEKHELSPSLSARIFWPVRRCSGLSKAESTKLAFFYLTKRGRVEVKASWSVR